MVQGGERDSSRSKPCSRLASEQRRHTVSCWGRAGVASQPRCKRLGDEVPSVGMLGDGADGFGLLGGVSGWWSECGGWLEQLSSEILE